MPSGSSVFCSLIVAQIDDGILSTMKDMGLDQELVAQSLKDNCRNDLTTTYFLLEKGRQRGVQPTISSESETSVFRSLSSCTVNELNFLKPTKAGIRVRSGSIFRTALDVS